MLIAPPKIDKRDFQKLLEEAKQIAPFYVPEWNAASADDSGVALLKIFFHILQEVMHRLNEVPEKNFIAFLDMLGVKQVPAQPSNVPLAFQLATGAPVDVPIPELTQAEAPPPPSPPVNGGGEALIFETEKNILATAAALTDIYSLVPTKDGIFDHFPSLNESKEFELFVNQDQQEHALYLGHENLFNIKGKANIQLTISPFPYQLHIFPPPPPYQLLNPQLVSWQYYGKKVEVIDGQEVESLGWYNFDFGGEFQQSAGQITLVKNDDWEIIPYKINNIETRWIRCILGVSVTIADYVPVGVSSFQVDSILGITPGDQLQIADWETTDDTPKMEFVTVVPPPKTETTAPETEPTVYIQEKLKYAHNKGVLVKRVRDASKDWETINNLQIDTIALSTSPPGTGIGADLLFSNDVPLDLSNDIYPFGTQPKLYDTFYIASQEAFSKKGAKITLNMEISRKQTIMSVIRVQGIGETFAARLAEEGIKTIEQLLQKTPEQLASILNTDETRAANILEAAKKEFYDKTPALEATTEDVTEENLILSWEYWDGKGWTVIEKIEGLVDGQPNDQPIKLTGSGEVTFPCPEDITTISVIGQENYWLRVRIVSGDYGKEKFVFDGTTWKPDTSEIDPPVINNLQIDYSLEEAFDLQYCLTHNNMEFQDVTQKSKTGTELFQPFQPLTDERQTLYLGFDKQLLKGPISLFFSLEDQRYPDENRPRVQWYYYTEEDKWVRLDVVDGTENLTRSGTVELLGPPDFAQTSLFGKEKYWLKAVDIDGRFQPSQQSVTGTTPTSTTASSDSPCREPCPEESRVFPLDFVLPEDVSPAPKVKGIYLNATWALQAATIRNEILGSSDGTQLQAFQFTNTPVFSEEVQVNEVGSISEEEKQAIIKTTPLSPPVNGGGKGGVVSEVKDASGKPTEIWVRWQCVDDFFDSTSKSRYYIINRVSGEIQFGDGGHGMIPPIGKDNIRATYQSGGGKAGNVEASEIQTLKTSIPFVDKVNNPDPAGGGSDTELIEKVLERGPQLLRNRGRAVTFEDYEWLAKEASPDIARVKCLPNFNNQGAFEPGWVTVVLVPESSEEQPVPSPLLLRKVEEYLQDRCSNVVVSAKSLQVMGPAYIKVSVTVDIYPTSINLASVAEKNAVDALKAFLHPLTGGADGTGWEFGRMVCFSDLYALLEEIEEIDHVENVSMTLEGDGQKMTFTSENPVEISIPSYALIYSGEHELTPKLLTS
ncbi:putative baseplate assembly protein [Candidatus Poribacteria bacterium]|nr:putative baseplate assembly protein [Candidatus Poribacteria bacterium]